MAEKPDAAELVKVTKVRAEAIKRGARLYRYSTTYKVTAQPPTEIPVLGLLGTAETDADEGQGWVYLRPQAGSTVPSVMRYVGE